MEGSRELAERIAAFFRDCQRDLISSLDLNETSLLREIGFQNGLNLKSDCRGSYPLFGYNSLQTDYLQGGQVLVEVKYIRVKPRKNGKPAGNEYDIKNALAQVVEQALCKNYPEAVLLVIDAGRARDREWDEREKKFISMFQNNPFAVRLSVVRVRISSLSAISCEII